MGYALCWHIYCHNHDIVAFLLRILAEELLHGGGSIILLRECLTWPLLRRNSMIRLSVVSGCRDFPVIVS